ncbi:Retrotransposable element Tf2 155 kDa protein type 1 [Ceratocystis lukuohia]|uniref:Retrotransposable element Tf2 155 kDa protein type 1 n=1 Tax=Ceratocystis lukuohia TaxID=2019550 RepID=A0ABR4M9X5_9PEZI
MMHTKYHDPTAAGKARNALHQLHQGNKSFDAYLQRFEELLYLSGCDEFTDFQKIELLKSSISPKIIEVLYYHFAILPKEYNAWVLPVRELWQEMQAVDQHKARHTALASSSRPGPSQRAPPAPREPPATAKGEDHTDWTQTYTVRNSKGQHRRAVWVSDEVLAQRRQDRLCFRCGASGHAVSSCPMPPRSALITPLHLAPFNDQPASTVTEVAHFLMDIGGLEEQVSALVVPNMKQDEILIGYPWCKAHSAMIDCEHDRLIFPHFSVPRSSQAKVPGRPREIRISRVQNSVRTMAQWETPEHLPVFTASLKDINLALRKLAKEEGPVDPSWADKIPPWVTPDNRVAFDPEALYARTIVPSLRYNLGIVNHLMFHAMVASDTMSTYKAPLTRSTHHISGYKSSRSSKA